MTYEQRTWRLEDGGPSAPPDWNGSGLTPAQSGRPAVRAGGRRATSRARVVQVLMMATSVMALVDLYLLATGIPH
jgi:hypothetical protein